MGLKERLRRQSGTSATQRLYERFGVVENPFPHAAETSGHPRLWSDADETILEHIGEFRRDKRSKTLVIEGTQGVGKTNLLGYYERELKELHAGEEGFYIIRYLADPEPSFDALIRGILQELGAPYIERVVGAIEGRDAGERERVLEHVKTSDLRRALTALGQLDDPDRFGWALEWLLGQRVLKRHRDELKVHFRLDTVESKTQVLRDLVVIGTETGCLQGIYLLLDELEKQAGVLPRSRVVRYLFALRALIDALPRHMFLMLAMTPSALSYYKSLMPAIAGRLRESVVLQPIQDEAEAIKFHDFYLERARAEATRWANGFDDVPSAGDDDLLSRQEITALYHDLERKAQETGAPPVLQREFCVTDLASLGIWDPEPAPPELTLKKAQELVSALVAEHGEAVLERPGGPAEPGQLWTEAMTESPEAWATLSPAAREVFAEYEARFLKLLVELVTGARQRKGSEEA